VSLNIGYRYFARHLPERTGTIYRDPAVAGRPAMDGLRQNREPERVPLEGVA
jgi:hypothetical protein